MTQNKTTVLIIDDNEFNLQVLGNSLRENGLNILAANSAKQGLAIVKAKNTDLIITDINLPEISGIEFCSLIRSIPETRHIPVIFSSASTDPVLINEAISAGGNDFLPKPINRHELFDKVAKNLPAGHNISQIQNNSEPHSTAVNGSKWLDTSLLDSIATENPELKREVAAEFTQTYLRMSEHMNLFIERKVPLNLSFEDLHKLANLAPYLANKIVTEEIRHFENKAKNEQTASDQDIRKLLDILSALVDELKLVH